ESLGVLFAICSFLIESARHRGESIEENNGTIPPRPVVVPEREGARGRAAHASIGLSPRRLVELPALLAVSASKMRAAVTTRYGRPEVVEVQDVPTPTPADNEVLVRIRASSVCFGDRLFRSGPPLIRLLSGFRPRHPILGVDLAGTVETVGRDVT